MRRGVGFTERDLVKEPLSPDEIRSLGERVGGVGELVGPTRRRDVEGSSDDEIVGYLSADPRRFRRPIIDTGDEVLLGFSRPVREALGD